ncbi:MAG: PilZ domain-containing protein [Candidatus Korobacteraceae bacterium]
MLKRKAIRFPVEEPVTASWSNGGTHDSVGQTRDVSTSGVFFYADFEPAQGSTIELVLTFPPEVTGRESMCVLCRGTVVRVEPDAQESKTGVAVEIQSYEVLADS